MESNNKIFTETIGTSSIAKTMRNSLVPTESTKRNIEKNGIIIDDQLRAEKRQQLKEIMDEYYRTYIDNKLSNVALTRTIDWKELFQAIEDNYKQNTTKTKNELEKKQKEKRTEIYKILSDDEKFKQLFNAKLLTNVLPEFIKNQNIDNEEKQEKISTVELFQRFTSSFTDFFKNRKNVFSKDEISTSICYRVVQENAWIFYQNLLAFEEIKKTAEQEIEKIEAENRDSISDYSLKEIFDFDFYGLLLNQGGIRFYNDVCGKINYHMNLYGQKHNIKSNKFKMKRMHKQILSIDESTFEVPTMFENDKEVYQVLNEFLSDLASKKILERVEKIGENVSEYEINKIYIQSKNFEKFSSFMCGNWQIINDSLKTYYNEKIKSKGKAKEEKVKKAIKAIEYKSLADINQLVERYNNDELNRKAEEYISAINEKIKDLDVNEIEYDEKINLIENETKSEEIKSKLDSIMEIMHWTKMFIIEEEIEKDVNFYNEIEEIYDELQPLVTIYNRIRNYVTQKPYSEEKIKLNFGIPTLANGWSKTKEYDNNANIMIRDGKYYLGIFNAKNKPDKKIMEGHQSEENGDYKKMIYRLLPGPNKMLPKVFMSKTGIAEYKPSQYILECYEQNKHIKSDKNFDIKFCRDLIDFFKTSINRHPEWSKFNFKFSETSEYEDISTFYREVEKQGYKIEWTYISEKEIKELDENGQLYLFQIYNKDFSEKSTGKENLHTMYLKNLFSEENLKNIVLKLNGEAEVFFRKSSIKKPIIHKKGSVLVNKTYNENGERKSIPEEQYTEIYKYLNSIGTNELSEKSKKLMEEGKVEYYKANYDIVKDYRYSVDKFFIHLPMTINFKAAGFSPINNIALKNIALKDDMHIIGIDRGERNLIYVSVIDTKGNIVEQRNFNIVNGIDYKEKLKQKELDRDNARKNWKEIGKIKDLKEGYLSLVVHEIAKLVVKYNAIITMEDLNQGFKRGRFKVERQVYQKFETMLINKLNYLVDKDLAVDQEGGLLRGYQLTYIPESLKVLGRQCGYIFYVPAAYTSKIDPTTGFVAIFNYKGMTDKDFVTSFDSIKYDDERGLFAFEFDYENFVTHKVEMARNKWTVYTYGERIKRKFKNGSWDTAEKVDLTYQMRSILEKYEIEYNKGQDILEQIEELDEKAQNGICKEIKYLVKDIVQMRNSLPDNAAEDYDAIISPVINNNGEFFDSTRGDEDKPLDADANGAYCIALKGLYEVMQIKKNWNEETEFPRKELKIRHQDWFDFIQNKRYL